MLSPAQLEQRRQAGLALRDKKAQEDPNYYSRIGGEGGRPPFFKSVENARKRERALKALSRPGRKGKENADC